MLKPFRCTLCLKKQYTRLLLITSANVDRFLENRSTFAEVMIKSQMYCLLRHTVNKSNQIKSNANLYSAVNSKRIRGTGAGTKPDRLRLNSVQSLGYA